MFDETVEAKDIFWEKFQGTGMNYEIFEVLFNSSIDKLKRNLTSQSSPRGYTCESIFSCEYFVNGICTIKADECPRR